MLKNMEVTAQRERERVQKEMREAERAARLARNRRGGRAGRAGGRGGRGARGRAGSTAFTQITLDKDEPLTYLDESNDDAEVEITVGEVPKLMETRKVKMETQMWKDGMTEWMSLGEAKDKVPGMYKVVTEGERLLESIHDGDLKVLFAQMDEDGSGELDEEEIGVLLERLGFELDDKKRKKIMAEIDTDGSGDIDFSEFRGWFVQSVAKNAEVLEFQTKRQRAHRTAELCGVRHGPMWDVKTAQSTLVGRSQAERAGFQVPESWEKRIDIIMRMGCGRDMAIDGLRQTNGHGAKAIAVVSQLLHVGPCDLPNATTDTASDAEVRFKMQSHFMDELKRAEKTKVARSAIGAPSPRPFPLPCTQCMTARDVLCLPILGLCSQRPLGGV